jgi:hypothetical protein
MPKDRWTEVGYEDFVKEPETGLGEVLEFLGINAREGLISKAVEGVSPRSIGKGRDQLGKEAIDRLGQLLNQTLVRYGYA